MDQQHESDAHHGATVARVDLSFEPSGKSVRVPTGVSVFDAASWNGIAIDSTCGGHGTCKKCKVQVLEGTVPVGRLDSRAFDPDQLADGWRLACIANATCDLRIHVPPLTTRPKAATVGVGRQVILRPSVVKRHITMIEPTLADQRPDATRVLDEITDLTENIDPHVLRDLPRILRANDFDVTAVVVDDMLVAIEPGDTTERLYGIACDLGTTTVVATLLDLSTGTPIAVASMLNKQQPFGADVISRISATMLDPNALEKLQLLAHETLVGARRRGLRGGRHRPCGDLRGGHRRQRDDDADRPRASTPSRWASRPSSSRPSPTPRCWPASSASRSTPAPARSSSRPWAPTSAATSSPAPWPPGWTATSGSACSSTSAPTARSSWATASASWPRRPRRGPPSRPRRSSAACGRPPGAVEVVTIDDDGVHLQVIGDVEPVGLCGSGLVDAVAELARVGIIDASGRYIPEAAAQERLPALAPRLPRDQRRARLHAWPRRPPTTTPCS